MSDVVAVAIISAGSSLFGAGIGALTTSKVSLRNAETTVAAADAQKEVELAKIKAENDRLRLQHKEDERRNKQATYHRALTTLNRIYSLEAEEEDFAEVTAEWRYCLAGVELFGSEQAKDAIRDVQHVLAKFPFSEDERDGWDSELIDNMDTFVSALRADIGRPDD